MRRWAVVLLLTCGCVGTWPSSWQDWLDAHPGLDTFDTGDPGNVGEPAVDDDGDGFTEDDGDCDDGDDAVHPDALELCNGVDDDCDGGVDVAAEDATDWYRDVDGDGYGDNDLMTSECEVPSGYVAQGEDCDDSSDAVYPGATEICNGVDDDCNGLTDDDATDADVWFEDGDSDGYGVDSSTTLACSEPDGFASLDGDCDDADAEVHPGADEYCNDTDDDCDGEIDDRPVDEPTWYIDVDGDGHGTDQHTITDCDQPSGYSPFDDDCFDNDNEIYPGAPELCDGSDNDCDDLTDEGC